MYRLFFIFRLEIMGRWFMVTAFAMVTILVVFPIPCSAEEAAECQLQRVVHAIHYKNCQPKRVLSHVCIGTCTSYARPDQQTPDRIQRKCQCCQETRVHYGIVLLKCANENDNTFTNRRIRKALPVGCTCRPCSQLPSVAASS